MKKVLLGVLVLLLMASLSLNLVLLNKNVKAEKPKDDVEFVYVPGPSEISDHWAIYVSEENPYLLHGRRMEMVYKTNVPIKDLAEKTVSFWVVKRVKNVSRGTNEFSLDIHQLFSSLRLR